MCKDKGASVGFMGTIEPGIIYNKAGEIVMDMDAYAQFKGEDPCPPTIHSDLWRQASKLKHHGLFEVIPNKIYQVRGFDLANITFIRSSRKRWIIADVLTCTETAQAAMKLFEQHMGKLDVSCIIISHSHIDHFGGIKGVTEYLGYEPPIIAPEGYETEAISENVYAGNGMLRRGTYMYGSALPVSPEGQVTTGLGTAVATGTVTFLPTDITIDKPIQAYTTDDGLELEFLNLPGAEAPAELAFWIPKYRALFAAELCNHTLHNLYTLRGCKVRSGLEWSKHIDKFIVRYGSKVRFTVGAHHWPVAGRRKSNKFWREQRDIYRFLHDQALFHANNGLNAGQIAEIVMLPPALERSWYNHSYYGSVSHNLKAQYQLYFGWFDGNPANLNPLPDPLSSTKYVEMMGGADKIVSKCHEFINQGELRWASTLLNHVIFADTDHTGAKQLLAQVYRTLGHQQVCAPWRNFYLTGACELELGPQQPRGGSTIDILTSMQSEQIGDYLATILSTEAVGDQSLAINLKFSSTEPVLYLELSNSTLLHRIDYASTVPTINIPKQLFLLFCVGQVTPAQLEAAGLTATECVTLVQLRSCLQFPNKLWNVVLPNTDASGRMIRSCGCC